LSKAVAESIELTKFLFCSIRACRLVIALYFSTIAASKPSRMLTKDKAAQFEERLVDLTRSIRATLLAVSFLSLSDAVACDARVLAAGASDA
jgi:hypothetical protein